MRISDWSSDVCSSDLRARLRRVRHSRRRIWRVGDGGGPADRRAAAHAREPRRRAAPGYCKLQGTAALRTGRRTAARGFGQDLQAQASRALLGSGRAPDLTGGRGEAQERAGEDMVNNRGLDAGSSVITYLAEVDRTGEEGHVIDAT